MFYFLWKYQNAIEATNLRQAATQARSNVITARKCLKDTGTGTFLGRYRKDRWDHI
jgi:hypothetical protein